MKSQRADNDKGKYERVCIFRVVDTTRSVRVNENCPQSARVLLFGIARWREVRTRPLPPLLTTGHFLGLLGLELAHGENALHEHDTRKRHRRSPR